MAEDTRKLVGIVELHFLEDDEGTWYSELKELDQEKCQGDLRSVYKLALIMAVVQDTLKNKLPAMDAIIKTNQEIQEIHNELIKEKGHSPSKGNVEVNKDHNQTHKAWQVPDTERYQTKLPFGELSSNDNDDEEKRQAEFDDWADNGFDDGLEDTNE